MKKFGAMFAAIAFFSSLYGEKIYFEDGSFNEIKSFEGVMAKKADAASFRSLKNLMLDWNVGDSHIVIDSSGIGNLPVFSVGSAVMISDEYIFWKGNKNISEIASKYNLESVEILSAYGLVKFKVSGNAVKVAENIVESGDGYAFPNMIREIELRGVEIPPKDPYFEEQWYLNNSGSALDLYNKETKTLPGADIKFDEAINFITSINTPLNDKAKVAVFDTGVAKDHEDLINKLDVGYDAVSDKDGGYPVIPADATANEIESYGHGTSCAGVSAAEMNETGVAGVCPWCRIYPIRGIGSISGSAITDEMYLKTYEKITADANISVVNCSFGIPAGFGNIPIMPGELNSHILFLRDGRNGKGGMIVYASGNEASDTNYSGLYQYVFKFKRDGKDVEAKVVTVAGTNAWDTRAEYSNFGKEISVSAPTLSFSPLLGITTTTIPDNGTLGGHYTRQFGGTSSAAPVVSGLMGAIFSVNPGLTLEEATEILKNSSDKVFPSTGNYNTDGHSPIYGYGRVNLLKALRLAAGQTMCENMAGEEIAGNNIDDNCDGFVDEGEPKLTKTGEPCTAKSECLSEGLTEDDVECVSEIGWSKINGGYCVIKRIKSGCPEGTTALVSKPPYGNTCYKDCGGEQGCERAGFSCSGENYGICEPECTQTSDCKDGALCKDKKCKKDPAPVGSSCMANEECEGTDPFCVTMLPNGYCVTFCEAADDSFCPTGSKCTNSPRGGYLCTATCTGDADCRPSEKGTYVCHPVFREKENICYTKCKTDETCADSRAMCDTATGKCIPKTASGDDDILADSDISADSELDNDTISESDIVEDIDAAENDVEAIPGNDSDETGNKKKSDDGCGCSVI